MTADTAIAVRIRGLSKFYSLTPIGHGSLYDRLGRLVRRTPAPGAETPPGIWALHNVDLDVPRGHVLGILGRNGSGKSTLMRVIARVTAPTTGTVEVVGRVGALLQVGTGFHPELTGRDNIILAGAILGMTKEEIEAVHERIVAFAEIGQFLDSAVKYYSSGMYLRLAFSVSAHLAAEVMLIDEVMAVGDAQFQERCRMRIRELVNEGRTVLFVSHATATVRQICDSAIVLDNGHQQFGGSTADAIDFYEDRVLQLRQPDMASARR